MQKRPIISRSLLTVATPNHTPPNAPSHLLGHDSIICATWLSHAGDMTYFYVSYVAHWYVWHVSFLWTTLITACSLRRRLLRVCRDSFVCATRLIHMCNMTHSFWCRTRPNAPADPVLRVWRESFACVRWPSHMHHTTHSFWCRTRPNIPSDPFRPLQTRQLHATCVTCPIHSDALDDQMLPRSNPPSEGVAECSGWGIRPSFGRHSECRMLRSARMLRMRHSSNAWSSAEHSAFDPEPSAFGVTSESSSHSVVTSIRHSVVQHHKECVMLHIWVSRVAHVNESRHTCNHETCQTYKWVPLRCAWICYLTHLYVLHDSSTCLTDSFICQRPIHMHDMTHSYVLYNSFIHVTSLMYILDMTHLNVWHGPEPFHTGCKQKW